MRRRVGWRCQCGGQVTLKCKIRKAGNPSYPHRGGGDGTRSASAAVAAGSPPRPPHRHIDDLGRLGAARRAGGGTDFRVQWPRL